MSRNRFAGICYRCGEVVHAGAGHYEMVGRPQAKKWGGRLQGKWLTQHAECAIKWRGTDRHYLWAPNTIRPEEVAP